jgi:hypothetical protein
MDQIAQEVGVSGHRLRQLAMLFFMEQYDAGLIAPVVDDSPKVARLAAKGEK